MPTLNKGDLAFFISNAPRNLLHQVRGEDRLFTTAMAVNALLSTWTVFDRTTNRLVWEPGMCTMFYAYVISFLAPMYVCLYVC